MRFREDRIRENEDLTLEMNSFVRELVGREEEEDDPLSLSQSGSSIDSSNGTGLCVFHVFTNTRK